MRQAIRPRATSAAGPVTPAFVQAAYADSAAATTSSQAVTLSAGATAGNLLVGIGSSDATITTPSGFTLFDSAVNANACYIWWKIAVGGETSISLVPSVADTVCGVLLEYSGVAASPVDAGVHSSAVGVSTAGPVSAGTTGATVQAVELVIAATAPHSFTNIGVPTGPSWTNSYVARAGGGTVFATGAQNSALFVAELVTSSTGTQSTATSWTNQAQDWAAVIATFKGA